MWAPALPSCPRFHYCSSVRVELLGFVGFGHAAVDGRNVFRWLLGTALGLPPWPHLTSESPAPSVRMESSAEGPMSPGHDECGEKGPPSPGAACGPSAQHSPGTCVCLPHGPGAVWLVSAIFCLWPNVGFFLVSRMPFSAPCEYSCVPLVTPGLTLNKCICFLKESGTLVILSCQACLGQTPGHLADHSIRHDMVVQLWPGGCQLGNCIQALLILLNPSGAWSHRWISYSAHESGLLAEKCLLTKDIQDSIPS